MQYATHSALAAVNAFTSLAIERETLRLWLSELPIGDEYQVLSSADEGLWQRFEHYCIERGIAIFAP